ncbi:hypothetical protein ACP4OV_023426 [Aristida adscensionis]
MDDDRADPRARAASPPAPVPPPRRLGAMDLSSQFHRRFPQVLPPAAPPRLAALPPASAFAFYPPAGGSRHARSLSQPPPLFSVDALGPPPPRPPMPGSEQGPAALGLGLPPRVARHRRSRSDFLVGFPPAALPLPAAPPMGSPAADAAALEELFGPYRELRAMGAEERPDHLGGGGGGHRRAWSPADSSETEAESWAAAGGAGASPSNPRHCRSWSADSFMGSLNFEHVGQDSPRLPPPSPRAGAGGIGSFSHAGGGLADGAAALVAAELANNGEFTEVEMKKIIANDRLAEMALADPKRVKRILANRVSAAKSKERKMNYMRELQRKVHVLEMEANTLSAKMNMTQREAAALKTENNEIRIRLQAMEQQAVLKDALNEALNSEVLRLKHAAGEPIEPRMSNGSHLLMSHQKMIQQHFLQLQKQSSGPQQAQQQQQQPPQESEQLNDQEQQY